MFFKENTKTWEVIKKPDENSLLNLIKKYGNDIKRIYVAVSLFEDLKRHEINGIKVYPDNGNPDKKCVLIIQ